MIKPVLIIICALFAGLYGRAQTRTAVFKMELSKDIIQRLVQQKKCPVQDQIFVGSLDFAEAETSFQTGAAGSYFRYGAVDLDSAAVERTCQQVKAMLHFRSWYPFAQAVKDFTGFQRSVEQWCNSNSTSLGHPFFLGVASPLEGWELVRLKEDALKRKAIGQDVMKFLLWNPALLHVPVYYKTDLAAAASKMLLFRYRLVENSETNTLAAVFDTIMELK